MTSISCPLCSGPVELVSERPSCLLGHAFDPVELQEQFEHEAAHALWAAVRALEDSASGGRWRATLPSPPAHLQETIERADRQAQLLRDMIEQREGGKSDTRHRPDDW